MYILAVDTSSTSGSVALLEDERAILEINIHTGLNHSQTILPSIDQLLRSADLSLSVVDLFAVTTGPGSFTGLRIGISLIKGLALALAKPVTGVSTLDALAWNLFGAKHPICPMLDAKKGQVYASLYETAPNGEPHRERPEIVEEPGRLFETIGTEVILIGEGAAKYEALAVEKLGGRYFMAPAIHHTIRASVAGMLAARQFREGKRLDVLNFTPRYIRFSEAERRDTKP